MFDEPEAGMAADVVAAVLSMIQSIRAAPAACGRLVEHGLDPIHALADRVMVMQAVGIMVAQDRPGANMPAMPAGAIDLGQGVQGV